MADKSEGRHEEPLVLIEVIDDPAPGKPRAGVLEQASLLASAAWLQIRQALARVGLTPRAIGIAGLSVAGLIVIAVGLAQGLTASFRSSWPTRVAGIEQAPVSLSVERSMPVAHQKLAGIHDFSEVSARSGGIGISPDGQGYLPPADRPSSIPEARTLITVPVSQGRLLRFDEPAEAVYIADPTIADIRVVSPDLVYVYGKRPGNTNMMATSARVGEGGAADVRLTGSVLLRVVTDPRPADEAKQHLAPEAPADIVMFGSRPAIKGRFRTIDEAVDVANIAQTYAQDGQPPLNSAEIDGANQINIRVRFAEVSRSDLKSFGIDWGVNVNAGNFSFGLARSSREGGSATEDANSKKGVGISAGFGNFEIDLLIEALQANGALTVLAEPNLTALTGETASFLAGGEVPIPVPSGDNGSNFTVQYKPFGVSLSFTPTIVKEGRIGLRVKPEVSAISDTTSFSVQGFNLPSFSVRRAETVVEVASGQTFALAGLFQREVSRSVDKMPVLGDVPVLGPLFRSERYRRNETELVILITPYLVNPVSDRQMATPLDRSDFSTSWQANIVNPDATDKGVGLTSNGPENSSGFILK